MFVCCQLSEGGWVAVQARGQYGNPSDFFARDLAEYERGFGNPGAEFWLGLDRLAALTAAGPLVLRWDYLVLLFFFIFPFYRIELETWEGQTASATYRQFQVSGPDYRLKVAGYSGTAGDPLR